MITEIEYALYNNNKMSTNVIKITLHLMTRQKNEHTSYAKSQLQHTSCNIKGWYFYKNGTYNLQCRKI